MLSASPIESGKFLARQISIASPLLRQTFANLRGATSWESERLTIAGIPLVQGLDLEALTLDLSRLERRRLGIDLQLDAYGGTLRASFQGRASEKFRIDVAGSASNISLAQISRAMGFVEPISGAVHASKFTFRGNPGEFLDATASVWMELTDFVWRTHRADNVMLGATYYDRRLEVDQLYVRQRENQLTINGELLWPKERGSWTHLPFRGQLNATIPDLNEFAELFGATTGDFNGALLADGELDSLAPQAHGRLALHGKEVKFRGVTVDSLSASLGLRGTELTLENLEARHADDFLRAHGSVELTAAHRFEGRLTGAINDLGAYAPLLPAAWQVSKIGGGATFDWRGDVDSGRELRNDAILCPWLAVARCAVAQAARHHSRGELFAAGHFLPQFPDCKRSDFVGRFSHAWERLRRATGPAIRARRRAPSQWHSLSSLERQSLADLAQSGRGFR